MSKTMRDELVELHEATEQFKAALLETPEASFVVRWLERLAAWLAGLLQRSTNGRG